MLLKQSMVPMDGWMDGPKSFPLSHKILKLSSLCSNPLKLNSHLVSASHFPCIHRWSLKEFGEWIAGALTRHGGARILTGWFKRFKERFQINNVRVTGEAASADEEGAHKFVVSLDEIITQEGYEAEQIFNVDETGLFWKRMPTRTYIHKEAKSMPGFKAFKDRLTLLLGGNIAGFKLKPFCIYHSENPRAFKNVNKHTLPVYFRSNAKAWMTQALFEGWFLNCFIPQVREYCLERGIPFKILLIPDNADGTRCFSSVS